MKALKKEKTHNPCIQQFILYWFSFSFNLYCCNVTTTAAAYNNNHDDHISCWVLLFLPILWAYNKVLCLLCCHIVSTVATIIVLSFIPMLKGTKYCRRIIICSCIMFFVALNETNYQHHIIVIVVYYVGIVYRLRTVTKNCNAIYYALCSNDGTFILWYVKQ